MRSRYFVWAGLGFLLALPGFSQAKDRFVVSETEFRRASEKLLADPTSKEGSQAAKAVLVFALSSEKSVATITPTVFRWCGDDDHFSPLLLSAYMAGNTKSQLDSNIRRSDGYAGAKAFLRVYRLCKKSDKNYKNDLAEDLLDIERKGLLLDHVKKLSLHDVGEPTDASKDPLDDPLVRMRKILNHRAKVAEKKK